ncbi:MAG: hypothetical protein COV99_07315 [Bacteroidetes bacterium CG12_big_fil_rev_8_21_14_0_65_60_17]|nr:MAG: hypothetical protein COV99_07315 [Bacteroidetes bacterium CG12_big_fil_rev_8_21_14_0_65_60_17]
MSLDVSPDGARIVFDLLGDLYEVPFEGRDAKRLTSGLAFDSQPRYSPNGAEMVFSSDRDGGQNIWTMTLADSTFRQISKGADNRAESPDWMPDGKYIVASIGKFRGGGLPAIKLFHVNRGSGLTPIDDTNDTKFAGTGSTTPNSRSISSRSTYWNRATALRAAPVTARAFGQRSVPTAAGWYTARGMTPRRASLSGICPRRRISQLRTGSYIPEPSSDVEVCLDARRRYHRYTPYRLITTQADSMKMAGRLTSTESDTSTRAAPTPFMIDQRRLSLETRPV